jgi:Holliday junction resolvasome RuvABC endonuclease subunit
MPSALGVDLSLASCGIAFIRADGTLRFVTTVRPAKYGAMTQVQKRLLILKAIMRVYYMVNGVDVIVMEPARLFTSGKNVPLVSIEAIISLATTVEDWAFKVGIKVVKVSPPSWRKQILGSGKARKKDAVTYVLDKYGRDLGEDAAEEFVRLSLVCADWKFLMNKERRREGLEC